jgi:hypothetical protein
VPISLTNPTNVRDRHSNQTGLTDCTSLLRYSALECDFKGIAVHALRGMLCVPLSTYGDVSRSLPQNIAPGGVEALEKSEMELNSASTARLARSLALRAIGSTRLESSNSEPTKSLCI